ncbi:hypothetical protein BC826DRAFT_317227 [Russula brevipes]|nr:hypothetical protein BC826DRAFT_317227 [Russula brevipes]
MWGDGRLCFGYQTTCFRHGSTLKYSHTCLDDVITVGARGNVYPQEDHQTEVVIEGVFETMREMKTSGRVSAGSDRLRTLLGGFVLVGGPRRAVQRQRTAKADERRGERQKRRSYSMSRWVARTLRSLFTYTSLVIRPKAKIRRDHLREWSRTKGSSRRADADDERQEQFTTYVGSRRTGRDDGHSKWLETSEA